MARPHTLRLACHATALVMEAAGGVLVLLNTVRLNGGELEKFRAWYYHSAVLGFILLFGGLLLAAVVLWMEHVAHARSLRASGDGTAGSAAGPVRQDIGVPGTGEYPQNISEEEAELKFERLLIDGIGALRGGQRFPKPVPVIARVLSPSDVLIKVYDLEGRVRYSHRRWGYSKLLSNPDRCKWHVLGNPIMEPKQLIFDHSSTHHKPLIQDDIVGVSFVYRLA